MEENTILSTVLESVKMNRTPTDQKVGGSNPLTHVIRTGEHPVLLVCISICIYC